MEKLPNITKRIPHRCIEKTTPFKYSIQLWFIYECFFQNTISIQTFINSSIVIGNLEKLKLKSYIKKKHTIFIDKFILICIKSVISIPLKIFCIQRIFHHKPCKKIIFQIVYFGIFKEVLNNLNINPFIAIQFFVAASNDITTLPYFYYKHF